VTRHQDGLARRVVERLAVEIEARDAGPRSGGEHVTDGQRQHGGLCYLTMALRRARGMILRLVRRRALAILVGLALAVPAGWIEFSGRDRAWWLEGLALVVGATGLAMVWTGLTGASPDWVDEEGT
jgi:hypothetical protein